MNKYEKFVRDAAAFIRFALRNNLPSTTILGTLIHDIGGLEREEECFLPRVDGYADTERKRAA